jgi:hypothetical protein
MTTKATTSDFIIIGSGCSAAMAAQTLAESGASVMILDVGSSPQPRTIPDSNFIDVRRSDTNQYDFMLGKHGEGIDWTDIGKGAQITPPRKHMVERVDELIPLESSTFSPVESLGYGGLGIGWGLQCWEYSESDMLRAGLPVDKMYKAYDMVSKRIGISATKDAAANYTMGKLHTYDPSPDMDRNHKHIYERYARKQQRLNNDGIYMSRTPLALITKDRPGRRAYQYRDLDYYSDNDKSAWRPWVTFDELRKLPNVTYLKDRLVLTYIEKAGAVQVTVRNLITGSEEQFTGGKLVICGSALGSARIVLRSAAAYDHKLPLLCNPYTYIPCLQPAFVGRAVEPRKLGMAQLSLFLDEQHNNQDTSVASLYSYQSLMLFRTIRQIPLGLQDAKEVLRYLQTGLVILGVHHPDVQTDQKFIKLMSDSGSEHLTAEYALSDDELSKYAGREKKFISAAHKVGLYPLKRINPGYGSSIHYAGTLPFSETPEPFTLDHTGKLHGAKNVYVADSSGFKYLPARGLTFSLMANAHLVAQNILKEGT